MALFLISEDDFGLLGELFGRTLGHVDDKKAIWGDFEPHLETQKGRTIQRRGSSVEQRRVKEDPGFNMPPAGAPRAPISLKDE